MQKITASRLTDLLNGGFAGGEVTFSGTVSARSEPLEFGVYGKDFYKGKGDFVLSNLRDREYSLMIRSNGGNSSVFMFRLKQGEKFGHSNPANYGDIVSAAIEMGPEAYLQIEPREIKF